MTSKNVLIIGGGVAGLSAAVELAQFDVQVDVVEKSAFPGGHGIQFACKATDKCVKCGACVVEEKLKTAVEDPRVRVFPASQVRVAEKDGGHSATIQSGPVCIDPGKCTNCGICFQKCPVDGAIIQGYSRSHAPFYALNSEKCLYFKDQSCTVCRDACPEGAIDLDREATEITVEPDAVVVATGFEPFEPVSKPYGYGVFEDVITTLDLERMLRRNGRVARPSDGSAPQKMAFIQCVGSRDAKLGHLWCSKICCGSALRMARLIKSRQPETEITCFYIDIQTFGKDFDAFFAEAKNEIRLIRAIPGDIYKTEDDRLKVIYLDGKSRDSVEEAFDLVTLSIGITPCREAGGVVEPFNLELAESGFVDSEGEDVFTAGTVKGPMNILETVADAGNTAWRVIRYLGV
jgi:heterodisulfide reductase subunit A2